MSGIVNKVKSALHSDHHSSSTTHGSTTTSGTTEGVAGPHSSRAANAADPRVDSDLDGSRHLGTGTTGTTGGLTGTHGAGTTGTYGTSNTTAGPHSSNLANKADPRVDSDLDGSRNMGAATGTTGGYSSGTTGLTGTSHGTTGVGNSSAHNTTSSTTPHNSNLLNKVDPRVDATTTGAYDGTHAGNTTGTHNGTHTGTGAFSGTGTTGGLSHSTNAGPHNSNLANKADPRVDSDLDGRGNRHGATTGGGILGASGSHATAGSGTAQNTAGPHNSDMLNKLDPRVDSDRDGSKTYMGNQTHA